MNISNGGSAMDALPAAAGGSLADQSTELELDNLVSGKRWRGVYQIGDTSSNVTYGKVFGALDSRSMNDVAIRSFRVNDEVRSKTWSEIRKIKNGGILELIDAVEGGGRRVEITQAAPAVTLREWASQRRASQAEIELILRQLAQALGDLHQRGVVHLNLRTDNVYVRATDGGLGVLLGGLETATLLQAEGLVELSMDPFFAPPEAVGLYHLVREPGLRAWDWWSLGRVIQEVVLGRHIVGHILDRDVTHENPELRTRAENLLKEQDVNLRAGAVEAMPGLNQEVETLLHGLLTGSRDGRWGLVEVESWLRKEPVKDRYHLPKNERLFIWNDRAYLVPEVAEIFTRAEHWQEGLVNVFTPSSAGPLAHFIDVEPSHKKTRERFQSLLKLVDAPAIEHLPLDIANDVVMAVALKFLIGHHAPFIMRGKRIDEAHLKDLLAPEAQPAGLATVFGFIAHPVVQQLETMDVEVGRMLRELGRLYEASLPVLVEHEWISSKDVIHVAALICICLEPHAALTKTHVDMVARYAGSRDEALDKLFKQQDPGQTELVIIAYTNRDPVRFGYVTHQRWNEEQYKLLSERGEQLAAAGLWQSLGFALKQGFLVFGRWRFVVPLWFLVAVAAAFVGQRPAAYGIAAGYVLALIIVRFFWFGVHRAKIHHRLPDVAPWTLRSSWWRCRQEALVALKAETVPSLRKLKDLLVETNEAIGKLKLEPPPKPVPLPPKFGTTHIVGVVGSAGTLVLLAVTIWYGLRHPPKIPPVRWETIARLWTNETDSGGQKSAQVKPVISIDQAAAGSMKSIRSTLDELRRARREAEKDGDPMIRIGWPFKTPLEAKTVTVLASAAALPAQNEVAEEMAQLLVARYDPKTINTLIAIQVPTEKDVGLMLYDGRTGKISDRKVYTIGYVPFSKTWIEVDSKKAIFLNGQ